MSDLKQLLLRSLEKAVEQRSWQQNDELRTVMNEPRAKLTTRLDYLPTRKKQQGGTRVCAN